MCFRTCSPHTQLIRLASSAPSNLPVSRPKEQLWQISIGMYTENCSNDLQSPDASTVRTFLKVVRSLPRARAEMSQTRSSVEQVPFPEGAGEKQELQPGQCVRFVVIYKCSDCARLENSFTARCCAADGHQQRNICLLHAVQKQSSVFDEQIRVLVDSTVV